MQSFLAQKRRQRCLMHYVKAWRGYVAERRLHAAQHVNLAKYKAAWKSYTMHVCFDALKQHKQVQAQWLMNYALHEDMNVSLDRQNRSLQRLDRRLNARSARQKMELVRDVLSAGVASYFRQWKEVCKYTKASTATKYRDMVYGAYRQNLLRGFLRWKDGTLKKKIRRRRMEMQVL
jgi:hypothetical protein